MISAGLPPRPAERHESMVTHETCVRASLRLMKHSRAEIPVSPYVGQACQLGFHRACRATDCACPCHKSEWR